MRGSPVRKSSGALKRQFKPTLMGWLLLGVVAGLLFLGGRFLVGRLFGVDRPSTSGLVQRQGLENRIHLPKGYTKELFDSIGEPMDKANLSQEKIEALAKVEQVAQVGLDLKENRYRSTAREEKVVISDLNQLSPEIQSELSLYTADLINDVREQMGVKERLTVDEVSLAFAQEVSKQYRAEPWDYSQGHHVAAINRAAKLFNLREYPYNGYENLAVSSNKGTVSIKTYSQDNKVVKQEYFYKQELKNEMTLAELKEVIYQSLLSFLFDDGQNPRKTSNKNAQGHAKALLSVGEFSGQGDSRFGLSISFSSQPYEPDREYQYEGGETQPSLATRALHLISFTKEDEEGTKE